MGFSATINAIRLGAQPRAEEPWSIEDIPNLVAWYDTKTPGTIATDVNSLVTLWDSRFNRENTPGLVQANLAYAPLYQPENDAIYSGLQKCLYTSSQFSDISVLTQIFIYKIAPVHSTSMYLMKHAGTPGTMRIYFSSASTLYLRCDTAIAVLPSIVIDVLKDKYRMLVAEYVPGSPLSKITGFKHSGTIASPTDSFGAGLAGANVLSANPIVVGASGITAAASFRGWMKAYIVVNGMISNETMIKLKEFVTNYYGCEV